MKNTTPQAEDSIFKKKGFFIALYSCLGVVAILALVITVTNFGQPGYQAEAYEEDAAYVGVDQVAPYMAQADEEAWFRPRQTPAPPPAAEPTPQPVRPTPTPPTPPPGLPDPVPIPGSEPTPDIDPTQTPAPPTAETEAESPQAPPPVASFDPFTETTRLLWPVYGDIAMRFSMDALIYDPTLDQFRTNDDLRISAEAGAHVQASAGGRVLAIGRNVVRGNYVKIDHGNGWVATYGQLSDSKLVTTGDIVQPGQLLGTVGTPSLFGNQHGYHVNLRLTNQDKAIDPYTFLMSRGN